MDEQILKLKMLRASMMQGLKNLSPDLTEEQRLEIWKKIEKIDDLIEELEKLK